MVIELASQLSEQALKLRKVERATFFDVIVVEQAAQLSEALLAEFFGHPRRGLIGWIEPDGSNWSYRKLTEEVVI